LYRGGDNNEKSQKEEQKANFGSHYLSVAKMENRKKNKEEWQALPEAVLIGLFVLFLLMKARKLSARAPYLYTKFSIQ